MKRLNILKLRPTQMAIGMQQVFAVVKRFKKQGDKKTRREMKHHPVVAVRGPKGHYYIINGHHRTMAYYIMGHSKASVVVEKDFRKSGLGYDGFWKAMHKHNWSHLYDQFGEGPRNPLYLPVDIRGIADDPYRSLAWMVAQKGGYKKNDRKFTWAALFRRRRILDREFDFDWKQAVKDGVAIARSNRKRDKAKFLEGHKPPEEKKP